jgi:hypothetical protein
MLSRDKPASRHAKRGKEKTTVGVIDVDKAAVGEYTDHEGDEPIANDTAVFAFQRLSVLMSRFSTDMVLFDNQAEDDVFRDRELGENHRQAEETLTVSGVINGGGAKKITQVMDFHGFIVYQDDDACANILSQGKAVDNGDDYEYDRTNDCHVRVTS